MQDVGRMTFSSAGTLRSQYSPTCRMQWPNDFCTSTCGNVCAFASSGNLAIPVHLEERLPYRHLWETLLCLHLSETLPPLHLWETLLRLHLKEALLRLHQRKPCHFTSSSFGMLSSLGNPATSASLRNLARPVHL